MLLCTTTAMTTAAGGGTITVQIIMARIVDNKLCLQAQLAVLKSLCTSIVTWKVLNRLQRLILRTTDL